MVFYQYSFEKLDVWKAAKDLVKKNYIITAKYQKEEMYVLVSQMRRAAISISSNIAEECGRTSIKDQTHFYQIAYSSTIELLNQLIISYELQYIDDDQYKENRIQIEKVTNKVNALRKKRLNDSTSKHVNSQS